MLSTLSPLSHHETLPRPISANLPAPHTGDQVLFTGGVWEEVRERGTMHFVFFFVQKIILALFQCKNEDARAIGNCNGNECNCQRPLAVDIRRLIQQVGH